MVILIANLIANEITADKMQKQEKEIEFIKLASSRVKVLVDKIEDKKVNKKIEKIYDLIHSSPYKSNTNVNEIESNIMNKINILESAVTTKDNELIVNTSDEIISLIEERNRKVK